MQGTHGIKEQMELVHFLLSNHVYHYRAYVVNSCQQLNHVLSYLGQLWSSLCLVMLIEVRIFELRFINSNSNSVVGHSLFDSLHVVSGVHLTSRIVRVGRRTEAHASQLLMDV